MEEGSAATESTTGSGSSPHTFPSITVVTGGTSNKNRDDRRAEVRRQVEELLRQVIPEEAEHVEEMMLQFQGYEDELLETLQTMQERQLAIRRLELELTS
jgi:hypothetical protein